MPFWTLRRKVVATVTLMIALTFGWAAVVVAVALAGAHDEARSSDAIAVLGAAQYNGRPSPVFRARLDHAEHGRGSAVVRSEEHTSELQSQSNLVCRLLLVKKKPLHRRRDLHRAAPVPR